MAVVDEHGAGDGGDPVEQAFVQLTERVGSMEGVLAELLPAVLGASEQMRRVKAPDYDVSLGQVVREMRALQAEVTRGFATTDTAVRNWSTDLQRRADERWQLLARLGSLEEQVCKALRILEAPPPPFPWLGWSAVAAAFLLLHVLATAVAVRLERGVHHWNSGTGVEASAGTDQAPATRPMDPDARQSALRRAQDAMHLARHGVELDRCKEAAAKAGQAVSCTLVMQPPPR